MKKIFIVLTGILICQGALKAQTISINGFGGYVFGDKLNYSNASADIKASGYWGASIEGMNQWGGALELLYNQQNTQVPFTVYPSGEVQNDGRNSAVLSYVLLNFERYWLNANPHVQPYGGLGLGVLITSPQSGSGNSYFAWDAKLGVKLKTAGKLAFKVQALLLSSTAATGTGWYYGYLYTTYSTLWQFGLQGGITLDFGK